MLEPISLVPLEALWLIMLSVDFSSLSRHGALIFPGGGWHGTESMLSSGVSIVEETELSCVASSSLRAVSKFRTVRWPCSAVSEQMGEVWSHLSLVAE